MEISIIVESLKTTKEKKCDNVTPFEGIMLLRYAHTVKKYKCS